MSSPPRVRSDGGQGEPGSADPASQVSLKARRMEVIRDTLRRQEEPAMGKRLRKSEKLDLILLELAKLRDEVRKLARDRAVKPKPRLAQGRSKKAPKPTGAGKRPEREAAPAKRVAVEVQQAPQPAGRTASH